MTETANDRIERQSPAAPLGPAVPVAFSGTWALAHRFDKGRFSHWRWSPTSLSLVAACGWLLVVPRSARARVAVAIAQIVDWFPDQSNWGDHPLLEAAVNAQPVVAAFRYGPRQAWHDDDGDTVLALAAPGGKGPALRPMTGRFAWNRNVASSSTLSTSGPKRSPSRPGARRRARPADRLPDQRLRAVGNGTLEDARAAVDAGAHEVLVPMVERIEEVDAVLDAVAGRAEDGVMIETGRALGLVEELGRRPLRRAFVGLNDLMIERGTTSLLGPLLDGTVEDLRMRIRSMAFGFGGMTPPERGQPVPARLMIAELSRLRAAWTDACRRPIERIAADRAELQRILRPIADDAR